MLKKIIKKNKSKKQIDLYDADHPIRRIAIEIIQDLIEPLVQRGINGEKYYNLEDAITLLINKRIKKLLRKDIKLNTKEVIKIKQFLEYDEEGRCLDLEDFDDNDNEYE